MTRRNLAAVGVMALTGGLALTVWAADITIDQIPEKARAALLKLAGNNKISGVESEKERGVQVYEAGWLVNGKVVEAEVTADGTLLEMEESVDANDVPEAVRTAAEAALAGAPKIHYERVTVVVFEAEGKVDGKEKEVKISPAGHIAGQQKDEAEDADDDEADDDDNG